MAAIKYALIVRGPTGVGKSQTIKAIVGTWPSSSRVVVLDHGWGDHPTIDWRKRTAGRERYRDLLASDVAAAELLIVELGWGEPDNGLGASRNPREWIDLLPDRQLLLVRLSGSRTRQEVNILDRKRRRGERQVVEPIEG